MDVPRRKAQLRRTTTRLIAVTVLIGNAQLARTKIRAWNPRRDRVKNYRVEGRARYTTMTLEVGEFIRRVLIHALPKGFHRICHYGFFASGAKADDLTAARDLLATPAPAETDASESRMRAEKTCPRCGSRMHIVEVFDRGETPRHRPSPAPATIRIDTS